MGTDVAISVRNVSKDFKLAHHKSSSIKDSIVQIFESKDKTVETFHALKDISFEIKKGEFFGILGRNGSGKSTLLKIISNIYKPTSGNVQHRGSLVAFIELGVGFKMELSGRENVYLNGALLGFSQEEMDERYNEVVAFAELEQFMDQKLKNYSSGMKVRLAFAVAIQAQADILILDEVLAVGDASFQQKCYDYFASLKEDKSKTVVFVSHSMGAVEKYCDRALLIEEGTIAFEGTAEETAEKYLELFGKGKKNDKKLIKEEPIYSHDIIIDKVDAHVTKETITITVDVAAKEDVEAVIVGLDIYRDGKIVGGIDNAVQKMHSQHLKKHEKRRLNYTFKNLLGQGQYTANIGLRSVDGTRHDLMKEAVIIQNDASPISRHFPVALPVDITVLK